MAHPNETLLRNGYDAFAKGDLEAINELFADDVVFHIGGSNQFTGDYKSKDQVFDYLAKLITFTEGTFANEVHDVLANDEHGVVLVTTTARRGDKTLDVRSAHIFHLKSGKATEFWSFPEDQNADDEFFS